jgi:hypothetical protein
MFQARWAVLGLLAGLFGMGLAGCAPELNWRLFRPPAEDGLAGFSVTMPCKPVRQQRRVQLLSQPQVLVLYVCDAGGVSWALGVVEAAQPPTAVAQALVAGTHLNLSAAPGPAKSQSVKGSATEPPPLRYQVSGRGPDGRPREAATLIFAKGNTVVQLTALGERLADEAVAPFLASPRFDR